MLHFLLLHVHGRLLLLAWGSIRGEHWLRSVKLLLRVWVVDVMLRAVRWVLELHHVFRAGWDNGHGKTMWVWVVWREVAVVLPALLTWLWVVVEKGRLTHGRGCLRSVFHCKSFVILQRSG
jgi:hypothetical protein